MNPASALAKLRSWDLRVFDAASERRVKAHDDSQKITEMQTDLENERISAAVLNVRFDDEEKELQNRIKVSKGWKAIARKAAAVVMAEQKAKDDALAKLAAETEAAKQGAEDTKKAEVRPPARALPVPLAPCAPTVPSASQRGAP